ncbi:MAG: cytochrome bc complex cytochrome b subunit [Candidatus Accumulibacter sp.]|nr:cytochrome bc complex cytochrome b subunit [Accumulibacter sp.]
MKTPPSEKYRSNGGLFADLLEWLDARLPLTAFWRNHFSEYRVPKNLNFWYFFGSLGLIVLSMQILTGIFLAMHYQPSAAPNADGLPAAFASVEYLMRDVNWGWLIRTTHSTGASAFFLVVYLHIFRCLLYGSYRKPRELLWIVGVLIFYLLMAEAFTGYVLPWGQMSFWAAQVITDLASAVPFFGNSLADWVRGDFSVGGATLGRFFALHVIALPLALILLIVLHLLALREVGSSHPDALSIHDPVETGEIGSIPFHPYYTVRELHAASVFFLVFFAVVFFAPEGGGTLLESENFLPADPLKTPEYIEPVWYFTPFYSMLRAMTRPLFGIDPKLLGVVSMNGAVAILFFLPWLDRSPVKSIRHRGAVFKLMLFLFVLAFLTLGFLGTKPPEHIVWGTIPGTSAAQTATFFYFFFFLSMPWWSKIVPQAPKTRNLRFK